MKAGSRNRRGMTLMELMIVMVIIGVLVSLLLPATVKMRKTVNEKKERATRVTFLNAVQNYHAEYGKWPVAVQPVVTTEYDSQDVISRLRPDHADNKRRRLFWEGEDQAKTMSGQVYWLRINPTGKLLIGNTKDFDADHTLSVLVK